MSLYIREYVFHKYYLQLLRETIQICMLGVTVLHPDIKFQQNSISIECHMLVENLKWVTKTVLKLTELSLIIWHILLLTIHKNDVI